MPSIVEKSRLPRPSQSDIDAAVAQARRCFHRTLASWASDLLQLRCAGLLSPAWRGSAAARSLRRAA